MALRRGQDAQEGGCRASDIQEVDGRGDEEEDEAKRYSVVAVEPRRQSALEEAEARGDSQATNRGWVLVVPGATDHLDLKERGAM